MAFAEYLKQFTGDLKRLRKVMHNNLDSDIRLIGTMQEADYLTGGKQLRAIVAVLAAQLCGVRQRLGDETAVAIEFIHTATLLHDDVVDEAPLRRHLPAAAKVYGNAAAVLAGDFLYSRASQMLARLDNIRLLQRVADATNKLAEGELLQLINRGKPDISQKTYYAIIERKTANLFSVAAEAAALLAGQNAQALSAYGYHLGIAFQLVDDCLDYEGADAALGKQPGADFNEGKMTLPVILMLTRIAAARRRSLISDWKNNAPIDFAEISAMLRSSDALADVRRLAQERTTQAAAALSAYPGCNSKSALEQLAQESVQRDR